MDGHRAPPAPVLPAASVRRVVSERLGITPDEIAASHGVALSRPRELAELLERYVPARSG